MAAYLARQKLWAGGAAALREALRADAGELQMEAIRAVGERKLTSRGADPPASCSTTRRSRCATPPWAPWSSSRTVAPSACWPRQRSMRDRREMRKILDAIAVLGGEEAAEYLVVRGRRTRRPRDSRDGLHRPRPDETGQRRPPLGYQRPGGWRRLLGMANMNRPPILETLLAHRDWMRRMATALTKDEDAADDLVQDTYQTALRGFPSDLRGARGWLATVARNRWRDLLRIGRRRGVRERAASAESHSAPSPQEILERMELEKTLAELVSALPEAERQAVYLKYFDGCDSVEIGRRLGCPEGTVRWRIKVAIQRLRAQLDSRFGERRRWALILLPLTSSASTARPGLVAVC